MPQPAADLFELLRKNEIDTRQFFREAEKLPNEELQRLTELVHANSSQLEEWNHRSATKEPERASVPLRGRPVLRSQRSKQQLSKASSRVYDTDLGGANGLCAESTFEDGDR
jgi:hypothetical protein